MHMRNVMLLWWACALMLVACSSQPPQPVVEQARLPEPPAELMVPVEPNFLSRLLNFLSDSQPKPTPAQSD